MFYMQVVKQFYYRKEINELKKDSLNIDEREQDYIKGTINLEKKKILFLSIEVLLSLIKSKKSIYWHSTIDN